MKHLVSLLLVLLASSTLQADDTIHINFMAYNVENFFDCQHDTLKDDWAFTPKGANRWTPERYRRKAENIARVIVAAGGWNPPALVALCEVENERVMNTLCDQLKVLEYSYFITHSPDRRGIDVALLYRTEYFTPPAKPQHQHQAHQYGATAHEGHPARQRPPGRLPRHARLIHLSLPLALGRCQEDRRLPPAGGTHAEAGDRLRGPPTAVALPADNG